MGISLRELDSGDPHSGYIMVFLLVNTNMIETPSNFNTKGDCLFLIPHPSFFHFFFFQAKFSRWVFSERRFFLELRSAECPGIGNYKRHGIFRGISHIIPQIS